MNIGSNTRIGPFEVFYPVEPVARQVRHGDDRNFPGKLFVVEGIDGSGKSTQLSLLHKWLESKGYGVVFSQWNSSPMVKDTTKLGKKKKMLTPDRKSTRLNSSHANISYAVFCLKKK